MVGVPTYVLDGDGVAELPLRPVTVALQVVGTQSPVQLQALGEAGEDGSAVRPVPGMMVLPRVSAPTLVRVVPAPGSALFPPGTTVHVSLSAGARGDVDPDRAVLTPVDVSGLSHADLVTVDRAGERVSVTAVKTAVDEPLGALGAAARTAARGVLGVDQLPPAERVDLLVVVDTSASMVGPTADGSLRAAVEVLAGLSQVVSGGREVRVGTLGPDVSWLPAVPAREWGTAVQAAVRAHPLTVGFRSVVPGLAGLAPTRNVVGYVLTDAVPGDVAALRAAGEVEGEARHLVTLAPRSGTAAAGLPQTALDPPPAGTDAGERLLGRPDELAQVVRSLLVGVLAPDSPLAGRIAG